MFTFKMQNNYFSCFTSIHLSVQFNIDHNIFIDGGPLSKKGKAERACTFSSFEKSYRNMETMYMIILWHSYTTI